MVLALKKKHTGRDTLFFNWTLLCLRVMQELWQHLVTIIGTSLRIKAKGYQTCSEDGKNLGC